jgi:hypothetical protein
MTLTSGYALQGAIPWLTPSVMRPWHQVPGAMLATDGADGAFRHRLHGVPGVESPALRGRILRDPPAARNGKVLHARPQIMGHPDATDLTAALRAAVRVGADEAKLCRCSSELQVISYRAASAIGDPLGASRLTARR